ncbi:MAG: hypothetical protein ACI3V5_06000 [Faecousia sp.]
MYLFLSVCDYLCAALWLYYGLRDGNRFDFIIAALFLAGGLIYTMNGWRQKKKKQSEEENNG